MRHPRFLNHWFARLCGFFWLPCPICGEMFGGHEGGPVSVPLDEPGKSLIACWRHRSSADRSAFYDAARRDVAERTPLNDHAQRNPDGPRGQR